MFFDGVNGNIEVRDNGSGILPRCLADIGSRFWSSKGSLSSRKGEALASICEIANVTIVSQSSQRE